MGAARSKRQAVVVLVGLDGGGKTTVLNMLRLSERAHREDLAPTTAFNFEVVACEYSKRRFQFHVFDLAGAAHLRPLWRHYFRSTKPDVVLFVVDGSRPDRIPEAKKEFHKLVNDVDLARSEIVVVVNQKRSRATVEPLTEADVRDQMAIPPREAVVIEVDPHLQDPDEFSATLVMHIAQRISSPS